VSAAGAVASRRPAAEQDELVTRGAPAIRQAAREIRAKHEPKHRQSKSQKNREQREDLMQAIDAWIKMFGIDSANGICALMEEQGPYAVMKALEKALKLVREASKWVG
jgi:hypothetical protein